MSRSLAIVALLALAMAGCGSADAGDSGEITVYAAASLTESFTELGEQFEAKEGTKVTFNFGGSSALAKQIVEGAPADVFAAASPTNMDQVSAVEPTTFARNKLMIAVPRGNPGDVTGLADFADDGRTIALCAEEVPCGAAATKAFGAAGLTPRPDTLERDVKAVLTKVRLGEVDAALVYRTDVLAAGDEVEGIEFPEADEAVNEYPIAMLEDAPNPESAQRFLDFVLSGEGEAVLTKAGFEKP
ncbi:MAG: molybdate ABC transporter substrate-binding protein [Actinophytocola sp.]|uniref:molybdate ABC transporter substrate-binding protein n=1 Tax=Actinophytocola sp. TaxID=1872138 RepID=UPI003D6C4AAF